MKASSPAAAAPKGRPRNPEEAFRISGAFLARLALAALMVGAVAMAWRFCWTTTRAELIGRQGMNALRNEAGELVARDRLGQALRLSPQDPTLKVGLAESMVRYQNALVRAGALRSVDYDQFLEARRLLREAQEAHTRPAVVYERTADMARMIIVASEREGNAALRDEYTRLAAETYISWRRLMGYAFADQARFYDNAIPILFRDGRPDATVAFAEDFRHIAPTGKPGPASLDATQRAWLQLGEFHRAFSMLAARLFATPSDSALYTELLTYASRTGQEALALRILDAVAHRGALPPEMEAQRIALRHGLQGGTQSGWGQAPRLP